MAIQVNQRVGLDEFLEFVFRPENLDRDFEYVAGQIFEVVSNAYSSAIAMLLGSMITTFVYQNKLGFVTGADGGYVIGTGHYIPDVAFVSKARQSSIKKHAYNPNPPDLAIEVLSPTDEEKKIRLKIAGYMAVGVIVWVVDPEEKVVEVYHPRQAPIVLTQDDRLDGGEVLQGFSVAVKDIFPDEEENS